MKKNKISKLLIVFFSLAILVLFVRTSFAQSLEGDKVDEQVSIDVFYKAIVEEVLEQKINTLPDGNVVEQQKLKLKILDGDKAGKEVEFDGVQNFDPLNKNLYKVGEKVLLLESKSKAGESSYYITDYIRTNGLKWLFIAFIVAMVAVGAFKGVRALLSLSLTFFVIIAFIIPKILAGGNPIIITLLGALFILFVVIYLTEGINTGSHIAVVSMLFSLVITVFLSWFFVGLTKLSGFASEEMAYLVELGVFTVNFRGLLLAGIIIGTLGVLDDIVISQVVAVEEILKANKRQTRKEVFRKAFKIGVSHLSSMTNTLFLAYSGASMSLLILFVSGKSAFSSWSQILNNEAVATEIVRTLTGSIGLILAVPISTVIAVWWFKSKREYN